MRVRTEVYLASMFLIFAVCFSKIALSHLVFAKTPAPHETGSIGRPVSGDPTGVHDPKPAGAWVTPPDPGKRPVVQVAILLDTSSSMEGLIDQTRTQLWRIVNEFGRAERRGLKPQIEVALYEYGKQSLPAGQGFLRQIAPFTTDLDGISEALFALRTNGGEEYCGWVLRDATRGLAWRDRREGDLHIVFIAGNEPFSQGPIDYRSVCRDAAEKGIVVNTVFCGSSSEGLATGWANGAALGGGEFLAIDQDQKQVYVPTPQDDEIRSLSDKLNQTCLPYGGGGARGYARMQAQDCAVSGASAEAGMQRAAAKANSAVYSNGAWDLCDAVKDGKKLESMPAEELPAAVRAIPAAQRQAYVDAKVREREQIQQRIRTLNAERDRYLATHASKGDASLQSAVLRVVHTEGAAKGYTFK